MTFLRSLGLAVAASSTLLAALPAAGQGAAGEPQCILAGRLGAEGWAPQMPGIELLAADGRTITAASREALAGVRQVRLAEPALLSRCDRERTLAEGADTPERKSAVPAVGTGVLPVLAVHYPRMPRSNAALVELQVEVPAERVTMLTR